ncbi:hypothetical protein EAH81_15230 [Flavobacterium pectinovorum]|uniref:Uncharacterized protein n=1 Tax=Flavobacterium pectinovorum TaxID=29533 RepID=A0A502EM65_9FLAO|nr:hypothetical protein EAH81_15230 [Flavobacterium pectinovorum]
MKKTRLNKLEKTALVVCGIFIMGMIFGYLSGRYRFNDFGILYHFFWISNYIFVLSSFVYGIVNAILIFKENYNWKRKLIWSITSLLPFLYFVIMMTIGMLL